jgi:hypothetical protein
LGKFDSREQWQLDWHLNSRGHHWWENGGDMWGSISHESRLSKAIVWMMQTAAWGSDLVSREAEQNEPWSSGVDDGGGEEKGPGVM